MFSRVSSLSFSRLPFSVLRRRDASRSCLHPYGIPPLLSPTRHIPPNLNESSPSVVSSSPGVPNDAPRHYQTLPSEGSSRSNTTLYSLTTGHSTGSTPLRLFPRVQDDNRTSSRVQRGNNQHHTRSSSVPDGTPSNIPSCVHPGGHTDLAAVLVSPTRLSNRTTSPIIHGGNSSSSVSRTTSPRRNGRNQTESSTPRRHETRGERRRRHRAALNRRRDGTRSPTSPNHSVSTDTSVTVIGANGERSRPCSRTSTATSATATATTSDRPATGGTRQGDSNNNNATDDDSPRRRASSKSITILGAECQVIWTDLPMYKTPKLREANRLI